MATWLAREWGAGGRTPGCGPPPGFGGVWLLAVTCHRPDGNVLFPHSLRQGRVTPAHLERRLPAGSLACQ